MENSKPTYVEHNPGLESLVILPDKEKNDYYVNLIQYSPALQDTNPIMKHSLSLHIKNWTD
jgi:hypothetical protein